MPRAIDGRRLARFIEELEQGAAVTKAAKTAGVALSSLYHRRKRCEAFRATWDEAVAASNVPVLIRPQNGRLLQRQKMRQVRFDAKRKAAFLDHFAANCDTEAAAKAAGVSESTVSNHRRTDPDFAEAFQAALEEGYATLEAELLKERLAARKRLKELRAGNPLHHPPDGPPPRPGEDFERGIKLLDLYRRRSGGVGPRRVRREKLKRWSFDVAMVELEKKLRAFRVRVEEEEAGMGGDQ